MTNIILCGCGGRMEHTLANIQCLLFLKNKGAVGYLMDGSGMVFVMKNEEVKPKQVNEPKVEIDLQKELERKFDELFGTAKKNNVEE